ncbi:MAG: WD40 repeat domain-containing protein [Myxococcales bacterium]|nr:WD40 repeat domain-containing protein [Myxococcales bacterium]
MRTAFVMLLACALAACAAGGAAPATAAPRKKPAPKAAPSPRPVAPVAVGNANVDRVKKSWEVAAGGYGRAVAVSRALGRVAFANKEGVELFDLITGKSTGKVQRCRDVVRGGLAFHGGDLLIVCEKSVVKVDALKRTDRPDVAVDAARVTAAAFVGATMVLGHRDGVIRIYGLNGAATVEVRVPGPPVDAKSLALTRDGSRLAVGFVQGSVWWWEVAKPEAFHDMARHESETDALAFSDDGALLADEGAAHTTTLWELGPPPTAKLKLKHGNWLKRILFTRDGRWLVRAGSDGLELAEIAGPRRIALDTRDPVEDAAFDEHGSLLGAVDRLGRLTLWAVR